MNECELAATGADVRKSKFLIVKFHMICVLQKNSRLPIEFLFITSHKAVMLLLKDISQGFAEIQRNRNQSGHRNKIQKAVRVLAEQKLGWPDLANIVLHRFIILKIHRQEHCWKEHRMTVTPTQTLLRVRVPLSMKKTRSAICINLNGLRAPRGAKEQQAAGSPLIIGRKVVATHAGGGG